MAVQIPARTVVDLFSKSRRKRLKREFAYASDPQRGQSCFNPRHDTSFG
jgi:hypothetical protein